MPKKNPFEIPYMKKKEANEQAISERKKKLGKNRGEEFKSLLEEEEFESVLGKKVAEAEKEQSGRRKKLSKALEPEEAAAKEARLKKMRKEIFFGEKEEPSPETEEALEELRTEEKKKTKKGEKPAKKTETEEALEDLRAGEREKLGGKKQAKKETREEFDVPEQKISKDIAEHLKNAISVYPELLTPEIRKSIDFIKKQDGVIAKNEKIIEKYEGNAKTGARQKVKQAKEEIEKAKDASEEAQETVNGYINDLTKHYNASVFFIQKAAEQYEKAGKQLFSKKYDMYEPEAGWFARTAKERKLKKELGDAEFEKFEELKATYFDGLERHNQLLKKHYKKYSRLESAIESGTTFQIAHRGGGGEVGKGHLA